MCAVYLQVSGCVSDTKIAAAAAVEQDPKGISDLLHSVQVNIPAESGEMGILAQHVPSIEQLNPGLIEVIEESGGNKQFFRKTRQLHLVPAEAQTNHRHCSFWRFRCRPAWLAPEHQRRRGLRD